MRQILANLDRFTLALLGTVALASAMPVPQAWDSALSYLVDAAVALLFFLQGAKLSGSSVMAGWLNWRLQLAVLSSTFLLFPLVGLLLATLFRPLGLDNALIHGLLFLCCLPSTVQSSIAFTSIARGNVPAAVCAATLSNLAGILVTPVLVSVILSTTTSLSWSSLTGIASQLLLPFAFGQALRPWIGEWVGRHKPLLGFADRGAILLMIYSAFGAAVREGLWARLPVEQFMLLSVACAVLLATIIAIAMAATRRAGLAVEDEIATVFCGSKKSLITGVPMANILFAGPIAAVVVLPLILFHQVQLVVCAGLARRYACRPSQLVRGKIALVSP